MHLNTPFKIISLLLIILVSTSEVYAFSNYEEAYTEVTNLTQIAEKLELNGQFDDALENYKNIEGIFSEFNDEDGVAVAKSKIGVVYGKKGELDIALKYLQEAREVFHKLNDTQNEIATIGNSGKIYLLKGDLDRAISSFNEAYNLSNKLGDKHGEAFALANIGIYYNEKGNNNLGIEYNKKAFILFSNTSDLYNAGDQAVIIAFEYSKSGDWSEAETYVDQAKTIFESLNYTSGLESVSLVSGEIFYNKANQFLAFDDFQGSIENFYLAEGEFKKVINLPEAKFSYIYVLMREGDLFSRNGTNERAIDKFNKALDALHGLQFKSRLKKQDLVDWENLLLAKINFEAGIKEANNLNFVEAAKYFENSENNYQELINASSMVDNRKLISGYFYYSRSEKYYFLFQTTETKATGNFLKMI